VVLTHLQAPQALVGQQVRLAREVPVVLRAPPIQRGQRVQLVRAVRQDRALLLLRSFESPRHGSGTRR